MRTFTIGVPRERKEREGRVAMTPDGIRALLQKYAGKLRILVELGAGVGSGWGDEAYCAAGAIPMVSVAALYEKSDLVVKVKEPLPEEYELLAHLRHKTLFTYLHLSGVDPLLTKLLLWHEVTGLAYESVEVSQDGRRTFPLLVPMSKIAGTQAMRAAIAHQSQFTPKSALRTVILGGGTVGEAALIEAFVNDLSYNAVFDLNEDRMRALRQQYRHHLGYSFAALCMSALESDGGLNVLSSADIIISGVMNPGKEAPKVLTVDLLARLKPGAYVVDVAIDQGGSTALSRVTHPGETYEVNGVTFSCVPNIPGSTVPREATLALTAATEKYIDILVEFATKQESGVYFALKEHADLQKGLQCWRGKLTNRAVADKHNMTEAQYYHSLDTLF